MIGTTDMQHYSDIADAIRSKSDSQAQMTPAQMATAINGIPIYAVEVTIASDIHDIELDVDLDFDPHCLSVFCKEEPKRGSTRAMFGFVYCDKANDWGSTTNGIPFYYNPDTSAFLGTARNVESSAYGGISISRSKITLGGVGTVARYIAGTTYRIIVTG